MNAEEVQLVHNPKTNQPTGSAYVRYKTPEGAAGLPSVVFFGLLSSTLTAARTRRWMAAGLP